MPSMICSLDIPERTSSVRLKVRGRIDRTAGGLKQIGPRIFGFQNWAKSNGDIHDRSTRQTKSPSLCFWLFSSSLLLCDPSCAYFASDLRLEPSDAGGALGLVGAKRESAAFTPTSWYLLDPQKEFSLIQCVPTVGQGWARRAHLRVPPETSQRRPTVYTPT